MALNAGSGAYYVNFLKFILFCEIFWNKWVVNVPYQVVSNEKADNMSLQLQEYVHEEADSDYREGSGGIDVEDSAIVIYNALEKDKNHVTIAHPQRR